MPLIYSDIDNIVDQVLDKIRKELFSANRLGDLSEYLESIHCENVVQSSNKNDESYKSGIIVVVGDLGSRQKDLVGIAKDLGIPKDRFEFVSFEESKKYKYNKLQYAPHYRVVLYGPTPHSTAGKVEYSSSIVRMEKEEGFPKVIRMGNGNELKITKTGFKDTLKRLIEEDYIEVS